MERGREEKRSRCREGGREDGKDGEREGMREGRRAGGKDGERGMGREHLVRYATPRDESRRSTSSK